MTSRRRSFIVVAALVTAVSVYGGVAWLLMFLIQDVFQYSNPQADFKDLLIELAPVVIPPACAVLAAVLVARTLHGKREPHRGFAVVPHDRERPGAA